MTLFIEVSNPFQWKPWRFQSRLMYRFGWGWFAIAWLRVSFFEYATAEKEWRST